MTSRENDHEGDDPAEGNAIPHDWEKVARWETVLVRAVGERIGYGRTMQLAEELWGQTLAEHGYPTGGQHTTGPCAALMVPCGCDGDCDWCCGTMRVTKRVKRAKDEAGGR